MSKVQKMRPQIVEAIKRVLQRRDMNYRELGRYVDIEDRKLKDMVNGSWDNITEDNWLQVWNCINTNIENIVDTKDFRASINLLKSAQYRHFMVGLVADTGMGKTTALKTYSMRKNAYYIYIDNTVSPRTFLKSVLRIMGISYDGHLNALLEKVASELNKQTDPVLIIDECAKLSDSMILTIHSLRDRTRGNCGIVLAGMPDFQVSLIKKKDKYKTGYSEFFRRIEMWHVLEGLSTDEIKVVLQANGITSTEAFKEFRGFRLFGDLTNAIRVYKETHNL